jgi:transketolase
VLSEHYPVPVRRVGLRDTFGLSGKPDLLLKHYGLTAADVAAAARQVLAKKSGG